MRYYAAILGVLGLLVVAGGDARGGSERPGRIWSTGIIEDWAVEMAIERGIQHMWSRQKGDGSWPGLMGGHRDYPYGPSALVCYALLESDVSVQDPRMAKALDWLAKATPDATYTIALRANVWLAANRQTRGKYYKELQADTKTLEDSTAMGSYTYISDGKPRSGDNSNSQFGLLGVWAGKRGNVEVPTRYWQVIQDHWRRTQNPDGGWPYNTKSSTPDHRKTRATMTAGGVASLFVCLDNLDPQQFVGCGRTVNDEHLRRGLEWFDKNFEKEVKSLSFYGLYGVERVGLACGYKYFGTADWYKLGAKRILEGGEIIKAWGGGWEAGGKPGPGAPKPKPAAPKPAASAPAAADAGGFSALAADKNAAAKAPPAKDAKAGAKDPQQDEDAKNKAVEDEAQKPGSLINSSFALLFLIRGRNPVLFNKVEYEGDWNNRPRDLASLTGYLSDVFERTMNWQIINLKVPARDLHDAPILCITGSKAPKFSDEEMEKLRAYVWQGGTLFSATECNGAAFRKGIREVYAKLFPQYELVPAGTDHPIYDAHFKLRGVPRFEVVSNGVRPLVIHTDVDLPKEWQLQTRATKKWAFEGAANLYMYVTDAGQLRHRGTTNWPPETPGAMKQTIKLARLKHNGNCDPEPLAYERLRLILAEEARAKLEVVGPIDISALAGSGAKIATMTGTGEFALSDEDRKAIKDFVAGGGTLVIDPAGGAKLQFDAKTQTNTTVGFAASAEQYLEDLFGAGSLRRLSSAAPMFTMPEYAVERVDYRRRTRTRARLASVKTHSLRAVMIGDRPAVIFSREDLTAGLVGYAAWDVDGYEPDSAVDLMRNIILHAAGGTAPAPPAATQPAKTPAPQEP